MDSTSQVESICYLAMNTHILAVDAAAGRYTIADGMRQGAGLIDCALRAVTSDALGAPLQVCVPASFSHTHRRVKDGWWSGDEAILTGVADGLEIRAGIRLLDALPGFHLWCDVRNLRRTPSRLHRLDPLVCDPRLGGQLELNGAPGDWVAVTHAEQGRVSLPSEIAPQNPRLRSMWGGWGVQWVMPDDVVWDEPDWVLSTDVGGMFERNGRAGWLGGFIGPGGAFGEVGSRSRGAPAFFLSSLMDGILLAPGERRQGESALLLFAPAGEAMHIWAQAVAALTPPRLKFPPLSGWCSWYQLGANVTEQDVQRAIHSFAAIKEDAPVDLMQIDAGYARANGDVQANAKFPSGMKSLADSIKQAGIKAGLWLAPLMVNDRVPLWAEQRALFQLQPDGDAAISFASHGIAGVEGRIYLLDPTHPQALALVREQIRTAVHEWGYDYLKIDFTYALSRAAAFHDSRQTHFQMHRNLYRVIREAAGDDIYVMGCVGDAARYLVGLVDAARIGGDQPSNWPAARACLTESMTRQAVHGVWFQNDPDVFYLRKEKSKLSFEESRLITIVTAFLGGLTLTSDFADQWDAARRDVFSRIVPVCATGAQLISPLKRGEQEVLFVRHDSGDGAWTTVATLNWSDAPAACDIALIDIALDAQTDYHAFECVEGRHAGQVRGRWKTPEQPAHSARVWMLRTAQAGLHLVASNFHFVDGAIADVRRPVESDEALTVMLQRVSPRCGALWVAGDVEPRVMEIIGGDVEVTPFAPYLWQVNVNRNAGERSITLRLADG